MKTEKIREINFIVVQIKVENPFNKNTILCNNLANAMFKMQLKVVPKMVDEIDVPACKTADQVG